MRNGIAKTDHFQRRTDGPGSTKRVAMKIVKKNRVADQVPNNETNGDENC